MIKLENIKKTYYNGKYERNILSTVNCSIEDGEMIALMGRSGSGKTTLINILSALLKPTNGNYYFNSKNISAFSIKERDEFREKHIGMIIQNYALLNSLTAYENIILPLKYRKKNKLEIKERVHEVGENLNIADCLEKKTFQLSGGECQRVAIARALIKKPSIILADEPTGSLDSKNEKDVMNIFRHLRSMGNTIIIATHSGFVSSCCNRTIKINDGEIVPDYVE